MMYRSGINFHTEMIKKVLVAPINLFFDTTPSGLIVNRLVGDLS